MSRNYQYDYYTVSIPGDLSTRMEDLADQAIVEAKERTRLYCVPAMWIAWSIEGDSEVKFRVCRKRQRQGNVAR